MKYSAAFLPLLLAVSSNAFQQSSVFSKPALLSSSSSLHASLTTAPAAKDALMIVAERIKADQGVLVYDTKAKADLERAVAELEAVGAKPTQADFEKLFMGDWILACTTATGKDGIDTSKIPFLKDGPLQQIRQSLNRSVKVVQSIRSTTNTMTVDRVDHIIEYMPPRTLSDVLGNSVPDALKSLNLNPLELTKSKVSLVHKAEVTSVIPTLSTKLCLQSVVLNVAGKNQFMDAAGADVLGVNVPLVGDFLNAGSFETTYMDRTIRISRSKLGGVVDQLRIFVRADALPEEFETAGWEEKDTEASNDYPSDVELAEVEWVEEEDTSDSSGGGGASDEYPSDVELEEVEWVDDSPEDPAAETTPADDDASAENSSDSSDDYPSDVEM